MGRSAGTSPGAARRSACATGYAGSGKSARVPNGHVDRVANQRTTSWLKRANQRQAQASPPRANTAHNHDVIHTAGSQAAARRGGGNRRAAGRRSSLNGDSDSLRVSVNRPRPLVARRPGAANPNSRFLARRKMQLRRWFQSLLRHASPHYPASSAVACHRAAARSTPG